jgi:hypothetical protein
MRSRPRQSLIAYDIDGRLLYMIMIYCLWHWLSSAISDHDLLFVTLAVVCYIWSWFIVCNIGCRLLYMIMIYCVWHRLSSDIYHHDFIACDIGCRLLYMIMIYCLLHRLSSAIYDHNLLFVTSTVVCYIWSWFIVCDINCRLLYMITILLLVTSPVIMIYCLGHRLSSWYIVCDIGCRLLYMIMIYCLWHRLSSAMYDHDLHSTSFLINLFGMEFLLFCQYLLKYWRF